MPNFSYHTAVWVAIGVVGVGLAQIKWSLDGELSYINVYPVVVHCSNAECKIKQLPVISYRANGLSGAVALVERENGFVDVVKNCSVFDYKNFECSEITVISGDIYSYRNIVHGRAELKSGLHYASWINWVLSGYDSTSKYSDVIYRDAR